MTIDASPLSPRARPPLVMADTDTPPPSSRPPKSLPPPLPESASSIPPSRAAADNLFAERMLDRLAAGDYAGAVAAADALLEYRPRDQDALDCAQIARSELRKLYLARIGSLDRVAHVAMGPEALFAMQGLDFRAGYLVARFDGLASLHEIIASSGIPSHDALRIVSELLLMRVIAFDED